MALRIRPKQIQQSVHLAAMQPAGPPGVPVTGELRFSGGKRRRRTWHDDEAGAGQVKLQVSPCPRDTQDGGIAVRATHDRTHSMRVNDECTEGTVDPAV